MNGRVGLAVAVVLIVVLAGIASFVLLERLKTTSTTGAIVLPPCLASNGTTAGRGADANATQGNWTTYHGGPARLGYGSSTPIDTVRPAWSTPAALDGQVYAEPLVCGDVVYVATENNSVYAINASSGSTIWRTNLGTPVDGSVLPCGDIDPSGITGTPVIDLATRTLYAVAFLNPTHHVLFGLDLANGTVSSQVAVDAAGADPMVEQQRGALALYDGVVYIPYGGLAGDCGEYHGWIVGVPSHGSSAILSYQVPTGREGGIWAAAGITISPNGTLYVATGNSDATSTFDYGDSVIALSPQLQVLSYFAPTNWAELNSGDVDLGSTAPALLPDGQLFQIGKQGVGYLLSGSDLGGVGGQLYDATVCGGAYGGTAQVGGSILVPCTNGLFDLTVTPSSFATQWSTSSFDAGPPVVSGNVAWCVDISSAQLLGFNLSTGQQAYAFPLGSVDHFITPALAPGALFVAGGDELSAFALG